ncbi:MULTISPECIES: proline racemase family protein [Streptomyces]|uniref:Proline racemase n=2 Tax=Streptomyces TaxID=1883 RepID=A0A3M8FA60_9ACTN|nr:MULTISPECIES: proline racemase family protein [Streptomyces]KNE83849.1 proline racemase [Streptomyces fradiae]OFA55724.1 proline racemase [Streptomyces fradiae]PQM23922.1 proline racemase [Streptomyces xinghaiensis]RKM91969.1 proline racemase [Streptomyces xinghaiensis]RNC73614.1 proline racemase [Streptomyces xinghaiensis]
MRRRDPIETIDWHTGGEPFRIVPDSPAAVTGYGLTVAERRIVAMESEDVQWMRALLCSEPRGHADMYGGFLVPPDDADAHLGVLFWHKDGFSTACGHGTIALGAWAVTSGRVPAPVNGVTDVVVDVPSGRVTASVRTSGGVVEEVTFTNVAGHVHAGGVEVATSRGRVSVDIGFGGAMYAVLPAEAVGLRVRPQEVTKLIAVGREIRDALNAAGAAEHPSDDRLSGVYGTVFTEEVSPPRLRAGGGRQLHQRNLTVFADGEVDRSPCGSGTSARVALLAATGELQPGDDLRHESVVGSVFRARIAEQTTAHGLPAVVTAVTGTAHAIGTCRFTVDPRDMLVPGFVLR